MVVNHSVLITSNHWSMTNNTGRPRVLDRDDLNFIDFVLAAEPGLYLDEIQEKLCLFRDIEVSISTISRTLSRTDHTYKGIAKETLERNELLRSTWSQGKMMFVQYRQGVRRSWFWVRMVEDSDRELRLLRRWVNELRGSKDDHGSEQDCRDSHSVTYWRW